MQLCFVEGSGRTQLCRTFRYNSDLALSSTLSQAFFVIDFLEVTHAGEIHALAVAGLEQASE